MICATACSLPYRDQSAHMACCSPPYAYKRRYSGVAPALWPEVTYSPMPGLPALLIPAVTADTIAKTPEVGLLGLEPDPFAYIGHLVLIFREAWRVLRDDGILCVNIGDSYSSGGNDSGAGNFQPRSETFGGVASGASLREARKPSAGLKPKDLMGIPWRLALALQADGWYLRSRMPGGVETDLVPESVELRPDVIWTKNAMPESVRDRPSVDFEDVFIFSKARRYVWDQENGRRPHAEVRNWPTWEDRKAAGERSRAGLEGAPECGFRGVGGHPSGANLRASWKINTEPTSENHFAAFPRELVRRLISIGTSDKGCCPECGAQWERMVERQTLVDGQPVARGAVTRRNSIEHGNFDDAPGHTRISFSTQDLGWRPGCHCVDGETFVEDVEDPSYLDSGIPFEPVPCSVLDPFSGIGRTGEVCMELDRVYMPAELSLQYAAIQKRRVLSAAVDRQYGKKGKPHPGQSAIDLF